MSTILEDSIRGILKKINESNLEELEKIEIIPNDIEKVHIKRENGKIIFSVPKYYCDMLKLAIDQEKEKKKNEEKQYEFETDDAIEEIFWSGGKPKYRVGSVISDAKVDNTRSYLRKVKGKKTSEKDENSKKEKRNIRGARVFNKSKRFVVKAIKIIVSLGLAALLAISAGQYLKQEVSEYKEMAAQRSLIALKEDLGADKIWSENSRPYPHTFLENYEVTKNGKRYSYSARTLNGETRVTKDEILDPEVLEAIKIVTSADGGDIWNAILANRLADKIESGELDLELTNAEAARESAEEDIIK